MPTKTPITQNFYLHEFTRSGVAARLGRNVVVPVTSEIFENLQRLCTDVLQPLRSQLGPVHITSGYRPEWLNSAIGGSPSSAHISGLAADLVVTGASPYEVCGYLAESEIPFDKCINEFGEWVHISAPESGEPRRQLLTATAGPNGAVYREGIHRV